MTSMWISPVVLERLAGSLLHFVWQGAAIAVVAALALRLMRRRPPEWRYATASAALFAMLAAPFLTFAFYAETGALTLRVLHTLNSVTVAASEASAAGIDVWTRRIVFVWLVGVIVFLTRLAGGWLLSRRMLSSAAAVVTPVVVEALGRARNGLNFHRKVRLLSGEHIETPVVIGWLRPAILLPASALTGLSPDHLLAILAHELAHIRRHDFLVNGMQRAVECVLFYHPAVWWISGRMRVERERCCDDVAVQVCGDRLVYVRALVALENARAATPILALPTAGAGVADRVRRILGIRGGSRDWQSAVAALVFAAILVGAGMWQPTLAGPASPPQIQQPPVPQAQAPPAAPLNALIAIATAEGVREAQRGEVAAQASTQKVTQPTIAASREAARDRLGMLQVEYSAESFVKQAAEGDTIAVKTFLAAGMNINTRSDGYTALMKAAEAGQTETVQSLLAAGADPNLTGRDNSALILAASRGDLSTMKVLIAGGAQVDLKVPFYQGNALVRAAMNGQRDAVILLLDNKASIDARSDAFGTALLAASCQGHFETARVLVDRGANVKASARLDSPSNTPLHCAATHGNTEFTQFLLDKGADINAKTDRAYTPLMTGLSSGRLEKNSSVLLLIDRGADLNAITDDGNTALALAVARRQIDVVRALLAKGADPNKKGKNGNGVLVDLLGSPGGGFTREGSVETALLLINGGADVNATLSNGTSALSLAVQARQIDIVRALLAKGADPNKANDFRQTVLQAASDPEIRQLLINAGARQ
ncbi:MAG TPA: ankyrin repeat domain-containing protein [Terriglobia bacterium]|nr:ankyrin repeat domain-containing protein [Terriglobia bacterium]